MQRQLKAPWSLELPTKGGEYWFSINHEPAKWSRPEIRRVALGNTYLTVFPNLDLWFHVDYEGRYAFCPVQRPPAPEWEEGS